MAIVGKKVTEKDLSNALNFRQLIDKTSYRLPLITKLNFNICVACYTQTASMR